MTGPSAPARAVTLASAALCVLVGCAPPAGASGAAGAPAALYVANLGDATITRLDAASGGVVGRPLPSGPAPWRVAPAAAAGVSSLLVLSSTLERGGQITLTQVSRSGGSWAMRPVAVGVGARPAWLAGDGGRYGAVAYHGPDSDTGGPPPRCRLALVDHGAGTVERRHPVCAGDEVVIGLALEDGPAGPIAYLAVLGPAPPATAAGAAEPTAANRIVAVHAQTGAVVATLPVAGEPRHLVLAAAPGRDGRRLYAVEAPSWEWDEAPTTATGRLLGLDPVTLAIESEQRLSPLPAHLAVAPDGEHAYVLTGPWLTHVALGTGAQRLLASLPRAASSLAVTEARVYAANASGREVWAVDRRGGRLVQTVPVGRHPVHLALVSAG